MTPEEQHPSLAGRLARDAAQQIAANIAQRAGAGIVKLASAVLGAKAALIVALIVIASVIIVVMIALIGAAFQQTTAVWPVPVATDASGNYLAGGWSISSRFGWRDDPLGGGAEFHDGLDLVNPTGSCPFGFHCGARAMFDGTVEYVGWDFYAPGDPATTGGGEIVTLSNGEQDHETLYAHLEPYRLYVQLQGRIEDPYGRYDSYRDYQPIGQGELRPDLDNGDIEMWCANEMPGFVPTRIGSGTVVFLYDRPAQCRTVIVWGTRGGEWRGWTADEPGAGSDHRRAELSWQTPIESGRHAKDVALRFRAHLVPPPPPTDIPTATTTLPAPAAPAAIASTYSSRVQNGVSNVATLQMPTPAASLGHTQQSGKPQTCERQASGWVRCVWALRDIPTEQERVAQQPPAWLAAALAQPHSMTETPGDDDAGGAPPDTLTPAPTAAPGQGKVAPMLSTARLLEPAVESGTAATPRIQPLSALPTPATAGSGNEDESGESSTGGAPDCAPQPLVSLPGVSAPQPRLVAPADASFAQIRAEILARSGADALAVLADVLRDPAFRTDKPGVLDTSWHKAGRAVDLNTAAPFMRVVEGRLFRLYLNGVDITAIFEAHGWNRIPVQGATAEWWHYEYHPDGIAWTSAMLQVWPLARLQAAFPTVDWAAIGCQGGSNSGGSDVSLETKDMCVLSAPRYAGAVETIDGCGPPVRPGDTIHQLDSTLGFVGLTGHTTGPHLHLGLEVRSYDGTWPLTNICTPEWLQGRMLPDDAVCYTEMADPLEFLPLAPGANASTGNDMAFAAAGTPVAILPEGAPYQMPPPNYPGSLVFTPAPAAPPVGQYWSPFADGGRYGGGGVGQWICANIWRGFPWCD